MKSANEKIVLLTLNFDVNSFIDSTLALVVGHANLPNLGCVPHMGAAVGLQIQTDDLDRANLLDTLWQKIDFGTDQVWDLEGLSPRQDPHPHLASGSDLLIDRGFND